MKHKSFSKDDELYITVHELVVRKICFLKKLLFLFSKDALNWSKGTLNILSIK